MDKKYLPVALVIAAVIAAAVWYFYFARNAQPPAQNRTITQNQNQPAPAPAASQSLGGQIYEQAANPLANKLPDVNPAKNANPIQRLNVNPF